MTPPFNELGNLPPGIHPATLDEIAERFGQSSEIRLAQMESIHWMVELARRAGIVRIVLNGSFVTNIIEPNDVDCVLLIGDGYPLELEAAYCLDDGLPFLDIAVVSAPAFNEIIDYTFSTDRFQRAKGMIEVIQWN